MGLRVTPPSRRLGRPLERIARIHVHSPLERLVVMHRRRPGRQDAPSCLGLCQGVGWGGAMTEARSPATPKGLAPPPAVRAAVGYAVLGPAAAVPGGVRLPLRSWPVWQAQQQLIPYRMRRHRLQDGTPVLQALGPHRASSPYDSSQEISTDSVCFSVKGGGGLLLWPFLMSAWLNPLDTRTSSPATHPGPTPWTASPPCTRNRQCIQL